jgi:hypothetical protein
MYRKLLTIVGVLALGGFLSACFGGGGGKKMTTPTTPIAAAKFEDQFGAKFGTAYRAGANTEPTDVAAGDVLAVSPTAEPVPFTGT